MAALPGELRLAVLGPKGGCGRSTIAVNLAYLLATTGRRVALIDLAQFGSLALLLHLTPVPGKGIGTVAACLTSPYRQELAQVAEGAMQPVKLGPHTLRLLQAGPPQRQDDLEVEQLLELLGTLSASGYDLVIDTSHEISDRLAAALHTATHRLWVVSADPAAGWHTLQSLAIARELAVPPAPSGLLVNRYHRRSGMRITDLEAAVSLPVWGVLPDLPGRLPLVSHQGVPLLAKPLGPWRGELIRLLKALRVTPLPSLWPFAGRRRHGEV